MLLKVGFTIGGNIKIDTFLAKYSNSIPTRFVDSYNGGRILLLKNFHGLSVVVVLDEIL